jgi:glycosyltransferase involved in cell wall biosynthesis
MKRDLVERGITPAKCSVIPNGVDTDLFTPDTKSDYIESLKKSGLRVGVYLGTLSAYHGADHALALLERLQSHRDVRIVFAAGGSAVQELQTAIAQRGLSNALFLRAPSRREMPGLIASSDFMYMACGRPIFALATGETARVIAEAQCGIVEEPLDSGIDGLAASIGALTGGPQAESLGRTGRIYAERYCGWNSLSHTYDILLQELTSMPLRRQEHAVPTTLSERG